MPSPPESSGQSHNGVIGKQKVRCALAADVLRVSGKLRLRVYGDSMLPSVWPGDILSIHRVAHADLTMGELVLFAREDGFVVHRVVTKSGDSLITRGDSLDSNDPPVSQNQVLGRVVDIRRCGFRVSPLGGMARKQRLLCFLFMRCHPFRAFLLRLSGLLQRLSHARGREEATA